MVKLSHLALVALVTSVAANSTSAEIVDDDRDDDTNGWTFLLSTGAEYEPAYTGSDVATVGPNFDLEATYHFHNGHQFFLSLGEIGAIWQLRKKTKLSTVFEFEFGRDNADDPVLNGFPVVDNTVEAQTILQQHIGPVTVGIGAQYDMLDRGKGLVGFLGLATHQNLTDKLLLQYQVDASFADAEHMQTEVGINEATANATGYTAYTPDSGYKGVSVQIGLQYDFSKQWDFVTGVSVEHYGSTMSKSPLISDFGTETTVEMELGVAYRF